MMARWSMLGVNHILALRPLPDGPPPPSPENYVAGAMSAGLKVIMGLGGTGNTVEHVSAIHGVVGIIAEDEPDLLTHLPKSNGQPDVEGGIAELEQWAAEVRTKTQLPIFLNLAGPDLTGVKDQITQGNPRTTAHYKRFMKPADIVSADWYIANTGRPYSKCRDIIGKAVDRLMLWGGGKPVWFCQETSDQHVHDAGRAPTPDEFKAGVVMALIHGAKGIWYFPYEVGNKRGGKFKWDATPEPVAQAIMEINAWMQTNADFFLTGNRVMRFDGVKDEATWTLDGGDTLTVSLEIATLKISEQRSAAPATNTPNRMTLHFPDGDRTFKVTEEQ